MVVAPLAQLVRLGLTGLDVEVEVDVAPLVAVALEVVVIVPLRRLFRAGLLLLLPSSKLLMAALFNRSSSS